MRHWDAYTIFSVLSGVCMVIFGLVPGLSPGNRFWSIAGGAGLIGLGIYVSGQTSGTFVFPVEIFVIPFVMIPYGIYKLATAGSKSKKAPAAPSSTAGFPIGAAGPAPSMAMTPPPPPPPPPPATPFAPVAPKATPTPIPGTSTPTWTAEGGTGGPSTPPAGGPRLKGKLAKP